jgi:uncharacterized membrane protein YhiD involved in acid resistance
VDQFWNLINSGSSAGVVFNPVNMLVSLLLAFILGQIIAWVYYFTHTGLSYSRTYVQSLVIITIVVATIMAVIGNNIITAFGLMGALAIIRFRNVLKDTRDIVFIFCVLVVGMATGTQRYTIAVMATLFLSFVILYLHVTHFGSRRPYNGFLRFNFPGSIDPSHPVMSTLKRFCHKSTLLSAQESFEGGGKIAYAYQLIVRDADRNERLLQELKTIEGIEGVNLTMQEQLLEV